MGSQIDQTYEEYMRATIPDCGYLQNEDINHPRHYTHGTIEVIDIIQDQLSPDEFRGALRANIIKYILRAPHKGKTISDYQKARWYLERLIQYCETNQS